MHTMDSAPITSATIRLRVAFGEFKEYQETFEGMAEHVDHDGVGLLHAGSENEARDPRGEELLAAVKAARADLVASTNADRAAQIEQAIANDLAKSRGSMAYGG